MKQKNKDLGIKVQKYEQIISEKDKKIEDLQRMVNDLTNKVIDKFDEFAGNLFIHFIHI